MKRNTSALLAGLGAGALLIFFFDPARGRRRRALVRDKATRAGHVTRDTIDETRRDLRNRAEGVRARWRRFAHPAVQDAVLIDRVRARLGRYTTHARSIEVDAVDGEVTLRGRIDEVEAPRILRAVRHVPGVWNVIDLLAVDRRLPLPGERHAVHS